MPKIIELIEIFSGLASQVRLFEEFNNPEANRSRMERYAPIRAHREALRSLVKAIRPMEDRALLLTGSYGTGKSHLALMLANYLALESDEPEIDQFLKNWATRNSTEDFNLAHEADNLRRMRAEGRYLVAIGNYGEGKGFNEMILDAVEAAVAREGVSELVIDTHYQEADRRIRFWRERAEKGEPSGTYQDFRSELEKLSPGSDIGALCKALVRNDAAAMTLFEQAYQNALGEEFSYSKDNLADILADILRHPEFKRRYRGMAIIADEFGYILDRGHIDIDVFQRFAEMTRDGVDGSQLIFVGTGHKSFEMYSRGKLAASDYKVASDRVREVSLQSEEIEQIIAAIVDPKRDSGLWKQYVENHDDLFTRLAGDAKRRKIFPHLGAPQIKSDIALNIYPMHPMATHCLIQLSTEIGSDARSVFTFFTGGTGIEPTPGSFRWFAEQSEIETHDGHLVLITADLLADYFSDDLRPENTEAREEVRQFIRNYAVSVSELRKVAHAQGQEIEDSAARLLKLILVLQISKVICDQESLEYAYYCATQADKKRLANLLDALVSQQILFKSPSGTFEFRHSGAIDFQTKIDTYLMDDKNQPANLAAEVMEFATSELWESAESYNQQFTEDKRFKCVFASPSDMVSRRNPTGQLDDAAFFNGLEAEIDEGRDWKDRFDGVMIFTICESLDDIALARALCKHNSSNRIIVGVPESPIPILPALMNLKAALSLKEDEEIGNLPLQEKIRLDEQVIGDADHGTGAAGEFARTFAKYRKKVSLNWYGMGGALHLAIPFKSHDPADYLAEQLFGKRSKISHQRFNLSHPSRFGGKSDIALDDAITAILRMGRPIEIDSTMPEGKGEIRYLKRVLVEGGVLKQQSGFRGNIAEYELDTPDAYKEKIPALTDLIAKLRNLQDGETISIAELLRVFSSPPYGLGPSALATFLACAIRFFGDELLIKISPTDFGYLEITDGSEVISIVDGKTPKALFERRAINKNERILINDVYKIFSENPGPAGADHAVSEARLVLLMWWDALPNIAKVKELYEPDSSARSLIAILAEAPGLSTHELILRRIGLAYGLDPESVLTKAEAKNIGVELGKDKQQIQDKSNLFKDHLINRLITIFSPSSKQYADYFRALATWYKGLTDAQRDENWKEYRNSPSALSLVRTARTAKDIETALLKDLPTSAGFGLGVVEAWQRDRSDEYVGLLHAAFEYIERHRSTLAIPAWNVAGAQQSIETSSGHEVTFRKNIKLTVQPGDSKSTVRLISSNEDPREAKQYQRIKKSETIEISKSMTVRMVAEGNQNEYGDILQISFTNLDDIYQAVPSPELPLGYEKWQFGFPADREAVIVLLNSITARILEKKILGADEIIEVLSTLIEELDA